MDERIECDYFLINLPDLSSPNIFPSLCLAVLGFARDLVAESACAVRMEHGI